MTKSYDVKKGEKSGTYYAPVVGREGDDHGVRGPRGEHSQGVQHQERTARVQDGGCQLSEQQHFSQGNFQHQTAHRHTLYPYHNLRRCKGDVKTQSLEISRLRSVFQLPAKPSSFPLWIVQVVKLWTKHSAPDMLTS